MANVESLSHDCPFSRFQHQVGGHTTEVILKCGAHVLKPMLKKDLFDREADFYVTSMACPHLFPQGFFAAYDGIIHLGTPIPIPYLKLQDMTIGYLFPSVCDIKMGTEAFEPSASESKKKKQIDKYPHQSVLGFRLTAFKAFNVVTREYASANKAYGRSLDPSNVAAGLSTFFQNGLTLRGDVLIKVIAKLENLLVWFKHQLSWHFYCTSILIIYEGEPSDGNHSALMHDEDEGSRGEIPADEGTPAVVWRRISSDRAVQGGTNFLNEAERVDVCLVDFAHVLPSNGSHDLGFITGLQNLITCLRTIVAADATSS